MRTCEPANKTEVTDRLSYNPREWRKCREKTDNKVLYLKEFVCIPGHVSLYYLMIIIFWRDVSNYFHRETWGKSVVGAEVAEVDSITEGWWGMVK